MRKRRLSAVLALILALSMSFSSFAEEQNVEGEAEVVTEADEETGEEAVSEEAAEEEAAGEEASGEEESGEVTEEETIAEEAAETEGASEEEGTASDEDGEEAASEEDASEGSDGEDAAGEEAAAEEESEAEADEEEESEEETGEESEEEDTGDDDGADAADLYEAVSGKTYVIEGEDGSAAAEVTLTWEEDTFGTAPNAVRIAYVTDTTSVEEYYEEQGLEVIDAAGVDITFYAFETDEDGNAVPAYDENGDFDGIYSVQPVSGQTVTVSITLAADQALETEASDGTEAEIVIVHEADDGTLTELEEDAAIEATGETVTFEAESFSIYYTVTLSDGSTTQYDYSDYIKVDENTKTITVSQSGESAGYEIQAAINYIAENYATGNYVGNWTIVVNAGTYNRFFISEKYATALEGLTVKAADGAEVVIGVFDDSATPTGVNGATLTYGDTPDVGGVYVNVTGVTLSGLTFQYGTSTGYTQWYASAVSTFNNQGGCEVGELTISDCDFYGQGDRYGFMVCDVKVWTIEDCTFDNLTAGISFMEDGSAIQATIANNTFTNCDDAILESYAGGTPTEGTSYYLTVTGNTITGTAAAHTRVCIMNEYKDVDSLGTVTISGNTFEHANILLDCIDTTASEVYANNTFGECSWVLVTSFSHNKDSITDDDKVVTFYASTELGYWELTSTDGISTADLAYIQSLITEANKSGSTTLTIDMTELDLTGSSLSGYLSGGVKYLKTVLNWVTTTSVTVTKAWDDEGDADGIRPESVTVELYQNGEATGQTVTLSEDNDWNATFSYWSDDYKGLPIHSSDGTTDYTYTVVEDSVSGYDTSYAGPDGSNEKGWSWTVTNTHEPEEETTTTTTTTTTTSGSSSSSSLSTTTETSVVLAEEREPEVEEEIQEVLGAEREVETIAATGDDSNILFWLILMLAAGAGIGGVLLLMHPRQRMLREGNSRRRIP